MKHQMDKIMEHALKTMAWGYTGLIGMNTSSVIEDLLCSHSVDGGNLAPLKPAKSCNYNYWGSILGCSSGT